MVQVTEVRQQPSLHLVEWKIMEWAAFGRSVAEVLAA